MDTKINSEKEQEENSVAAKVNRAITEVRNSGKDLAKDFAPLNANPDFYIKRLPPFYLPSPASEARAKQNGIELVMGIELSDQGRFVPINPVIGEVIKPEIIAIRKLYDGRAKDQGKIADLQNLNRDTLLTLLPALPTEKRAQMTGLMQILFYTLSKRPERSPAVSDVLTDILEGETIDLSGLNLEELIKEVDDLAEVVDIFDSQILKKKPSIKKEGPKTSKKISPLRDFCLAMQRELQSAIGKATNEIKTVEKQKEKMSEEKKSEIRQKYLRLAWDGLSERYVEFITNFPDYLYHHLAAMDLLSRSTSGEIEMPKMILSIASGTHGELLAHNDFSSVYQRLEIEQPKIINFDFSRSMLLAGDEAVLNKAIEIDQENLDTPLKVQGDMTALALASDSVDMTECLAISRVLGQEIEWKKTINEMIRVTRIGGLIRLHSKKPLSEKFYDYLETQGLRLITPRHVDLRLSEKYLELLQLQGLDQSSIARIKQKVIKGAEYVLAIKESEVPIIKTNTETREATDFPDEDMLLLDPEEGEKEQKRRESSLEKIVNDPRTPRAKRTFDHLIYALQLDTENDVLSGGGELTASQQNELIRNRHLRGNISKELATEYQLQYPRYFRALLLAKKMPSRYRDLAIDGFFGDKFENLPGITEIQQEKPHLYRDLKNIFAVISKNKE